MDTIPDVLVSFRCDLHPCLLFLRRLRVLVSFRCDKTRSDTRGTGICVLVSFRCDEEWEKDIAEKETSFSFFSLRRVNRVVN